VNACVAFFFCQCSSIIILFNFPLFSGRDTVVNVMCGKQHTVTKMKHDKSLLLRRPLDVNRKEQQGRDDTRRHQIGEGINVCVEPRKMKRAMIFPASPFSLSHFFFLLKTAAAVFFSLIHTLLLFFFAMCVDGRRHQCPYAEVLYRRSTSVVSHFCKKSRRTALRVVLLHY
jgi:hypothetical protein